MDVGEKGLHVKCSSLRRSVLSYVIFGVGEEHLQV